MAETKALLTLGTRLAGGTKQAFADMAKGFKAIAESMRVNATALKELGKTKAAEEINKLAGTVEKSTSILNSNTKAITKMADQYLTASKGVSSANASAKDSVTSFDSSIKTLGVDLSRLSKIPLEFKKGGIKDMQEAMASVTATLSTSVPIIQQKWRELTKLVASGDILSFRDATSSLSKFATTINDLSKKMQLTGKISSDGIKKWASNLKLTQNTAAVLDKGINKLTADDYKLLGITKEVSNALVSMAGKQSLLEKELAKYKGVQNDAIKSTTNHRKALKSLADQAKNSESAFKNYVGILNTVKSAMETMAQVAKKGSGFSTWARGLDRTKVVLGVVNNSLKVTKDRIEVLNMEGLKTLGISTVQIADKLGLLGSKFDVVRSAIKTLEKDMGLSKNTIQSLSDIALKSSSSFKEAATAIKAMGKEIKDSAGVQQLVDKYRNLLDTNTKLSKSAWDLINAFVAEGGNIKKLETSVGSLNNKYLEHQKKINNLTITYSKLLAEQGNFGTTARDLVQKTKDTSGSISILTQNLKILDKAMKESSGFSALINKYSNLLTLNNNVSKETKKLIEAYINQEKSLSQLKSGLERINKTYENYKIKINSVIKEYKTLLTSQTKFGDKARDIIVIAKKEGTAISDVKKQLRGLVTEFESFNRIPKIFKELLASTSKYGKAANSLYSATIKAGTGFNKLEKDLTRLNREFQKFNQNEGVFGGAMRRLSRSFQTLISYSVASKVIYGFTGALQSGVTSIIEYDQALKNMQAITDSTVSSVNKMGEVVLDVAANTKFSAIEVAAGMTKLVQAGFSAKEAMSSIRAVADLASGTLSSLSDVVQLMSTSIRAFGADTESASRYADVFANSINNSKLVLNDLNTAFNYIGPIAKAAGLEIEDTAAAFMLLRNSGIRASTMATGFRNVLGKLLEPSKSLRDVIEAAGFSVDDFNPRLHSLSDIAQKLSVILSDSGQAIKLFGLRGSNVALALAQNSDSLKEYNSLLLTSGSAAKMAATQAEGLGFKFKNLQDKVVNLAVSLGDTGLSGIIGYVIDIFRAAVTLITNFSNSTLGALIIQVGAVTVAFELLTAAVVALKDSLLGVGIANFIANLSSGTGILAIFLTSIGNLVTGLKFVGSWIAKVVAGFLTWFKNIPLVSGALDLLVGSIGVVSTAITALVAVFGTLYYAYDKYEAKVKASLKNQEKEVSLFKKLKENMDTFSDAMAKFGDNSAQTHEASKNLESTLRDLIRTTQDPSIRFLAEDILRVGVNSELGQSDLEDLKKEIDRVNASNIDNLIVNFDKLHEKIKITQDDLDALSNKQSRLSTFMEELGAGMHDFFNWVTQYLPGVSKELDLSLTKIKEGAEKGVEKFIDLKKQIEEFGSLAVDKFIQQHNLIETSNADIQAYAEQYSYMGKAYVEYIEQQLIKLKELREEQANLVGSTNNEIEAQNRLKTALDNFGLTLDGVSTSFQKQLNNLKGLVTAMKETGSSTEQFKLVLDKMLESVKSEKEFNALIDHLRGLTYIYPELSDFINKFISDMQSQKEEILKTAETTKDAIARVKTAIPEMKAALDGTVDSLRGFFGELSNTAPLEKFKSELSGLFSTETISGIQGLLNNFDKLNIKVSDSKAVFDLLADRLKKLVADGELTSQQLNLISDSLVTLSEKGYDVSSVSEVVADGLKKVADEAEKAKQKLADIYTDTIAKLAKAQNDLEAEENIRHNTAMQHLKEYAEKADELNSQVYRNAVNAENKLHSKNLDNIRSEHEKRLKEIDDRYAKEAIAAQDLANSIHNQVLDMEGKTNIVKLDLENQRYQQALANLKSQFELAGLLESETYKQAVDDLNKLHELKIKQIEEESKKQQLLTDQMINGLKSIGFNEIQSSMSFIFHSFEGLKDVTGSITEMYSKILNLLPEMARETEEWYFMGEKVEHPFRKTYELVEAIATALQGLPGSVRDFVEETNWASGSVSKLKEHLLWSKNVLEQVIASAKEFGQTLVLEPAQRALDQVNTQLEEIRDMAKSAIEQIHNMFMDLQDQWDEMNNNLLAIEQRRYKQQLEELRRLYEESGQTADEYYKARELAEKIHQEKMKEIREQLGLPEETPNDVWTKNEIRIPSTLPSGQPTSPQPSWSQIPDMPYIPVDTHPSGGGTPWKGTDKTRISGSQMSVQLNSLTDSLKGLPDTLKNLTSEFDMSSLTDSLKGLSDTLKTITTGGLVTNDFVESQKKANAGLIDILNNGFISLKEKLSKPDMNINVTTNKFDKKDFDSKIVPWLNDWQRQTA